VDIEWEEAQLPAWSSPTSFVHSSPKAAGTGAAGGATSAPVAARATGGEGGVGGAGGRVMQMKTFTPF
tara:strand:- start:5 stop:208 length:204 start_codon:yes stop_codon:yes gene_type:complete